MDYKKKYEEAMFRMNKRVEGSEITDPKEVAEFVFPELKESEDERIREEIIDYCHERLNTTYGALPNIETIKRWLTWLERQGEQNLADKIEPKFKVGDWIVEPCKDKPDYLWHIDRIKDDSYWYDEIKAGVKIAYADKKCHLWTIQDAKNGDILVTPNNNIFIFKEIQNNLHVYAHCGLYFNCFNAEYSCVNGRISVELPDNYKPATKEQRKLLLEKIVYAGYVWNPENKELKKIEQEQTELPKGEDYGIDSLYHAARILEKTLGEVDGYQSDDGILEHKCAIEAVKRLYKQKSAWSEEDEIGFHDAMWAIEQARTIAKNENDMGNLWYAENWLKSLKERLKGE